MTDQVKVHQTGDGNCGIYSIACQFALLYVQAETCLDVKEKLNNLLDENPEGFRDLFHCLNRFHRIPISQQLHPDNFGKFIQKNIHTLRDLELFIGPAMRLLFETQVNQWDEDLALDNLDQLKSNYTESYELFELCKIFGLSLINFKNNEINIATAENFFGLSENQADIDRDCSTFNMQIVHNGTNHFDSVFNHNKLSYFNFDLVSAEYEDQTMYIDSNDSLVLSQSQEINGGQIWRREGNLFLNSIINAQVEIEHYPTYTPMLQIESDRILAMSFASEEARNSLGDTEINKKQAIEL